MLKSRIGTDSEAVRQQNCDVANRCNRADRSWHGHRESSGPRTTACDYLLRAERRKGSDRNSTWAVLGVGRLLLRDEGVCCVFWHIAKDTASEKLVYAEMTTTNKD